MLRAAAATAAATAAACLTLLQRNYDATENEPLAPGGSVVVVGAGVVGVSTADELSRRGFRVTVLEASAGVAGAASASHGNACTLGVSGKWQSLADAATLLATLRAASPSPGAAPPPPDAPFETRHAFHATNKFGATPLAYARRHEAAGWEEVAAFLEGESRGMEQLQPGERALRKIRAAMLEQQKPSEQPMGR